MKPPVSLPASTMTAEAICLVEFFRPCHPRCQKWSQIQNQHSRDENVGFVVFTCILLAIRIRHRSQNAFEEFSFGHSSANGRYHNSESGGQCWRGVVRGTVTTESAQRHVDRHPYQFVFPYCCD